MCFQPPLADIRISLTGSQKFNSQFLKGWFTNEEHMSSFPCAMSSLKKLVNDDIFKNVSKEKHLLLSCLNFNIKHVDRESS